MKIEFVKVESFFLKFYYVYCRTSLGNKGGAEASFKNCVALERICERELMMISFMGLTLFFLLSNCLLISVINLETISLSKIQ